MFLPLGFLGFVFVLKLAFALLDFVYLRWTIHGFDLRLPNDLWVLFLRYKVLRWTCPAWGVCVRGLTARVSWVFGTQTVTTSVQKIHFIKITAAEAKLKNICSNEVIRLNLLFFTRTWYMLQLLSPDSSRVKGSRLHCKYHSSCETYHTSILYTLRSVDFAKQCLRDKYFHFNVNDSNFEKHKFRFLSSQQALLAFLTFHFFFWTKSII